MLRDLVPREILLAVVPAGDIFWLSMATELISTEYVEKRKKERKKREKSKRNKQKKGKRTPRVPSFHSSTRLQAFVDTRCAGGGISSCPARAS